MPSHMLRLLVLLTAFGVSPAAAANRVSAKHPHASACPHDRARAAALAKARMQQAPAGAAVVTLTGIPGDRSLLGMAHGSSLTP